MNGANNPPQLPADLTTAIDAQSDAKSSSTTLAKYRTRLAMYRTAIANLRSHLANERTHLAYLRTTVSLIGFGITLNRFSHYLMQEKMAPERAGLLRDTGNAGLGMVLLGLVLCVWAVYRFWRVNQDIEQGIYVARQKGTMIVSIGLLVLGGFTALWLMWR
jgi:putative membrane protein